MPRELIVLCQDCGEEEAAACQDYCGECSLRRRSLKLCSRCSALISEDSRTGVCDSCYQAARESADEIDRELRRSDHAA